MLSQTECVFTMPSPINTWRAEIFQSLDIKLDQIIEENNMETIDDITGAIFHNKSEILGELILGLIKRKYSHLLDQEYFNCPICGKRLKAWNKKVKRNIESLGGSMDLYRPYFYCKNCGDGFYPIDKALGLAPATKQHDIQDLEAWLPSELPYETAVEAFSKCTGDSLSADHMFETTNRIAGQFDLLDICPAKEQIEGKINELFYGRFCRPVMMIAMDGAHAPARFD